MKGKTLWFRANAVLVGLCLLGAAAAAHAATQLVSSHNGAIPVTAGGNGGSTGPVITPDGRFVVFTSTANNLIIGQNGLLTSQVYLYDRLSNTTSLVSVNTNGTGGGNGHSSQGQVSANGRYVVFLSDASDLVAGDANGLMDIFERDLVAGTTSLISVATNGGSGNARSYYPVMTPDGRNVAFISQASNLVPGDNNGGDDVFVRDTISGTTTLVTIGATGATIGAVSMDQPGITPDGRYVTFFSDAAGMVAGNSAYTPQVFERDMVAGNTTWLSTNLPQSSGYGSIYPLASDNGRYVSFEYLGPGGLPNFQIFRFDTTTQSNTLITNNGLHPAPYVPASAFNGYSIPFPDADTYAPRMTSDGRRMVYMSSDRNIHVWDAQTSNNVVVTLDLSNNPTS